MTPSLLPARWQDRIVLTASGCWIWEGTRTARGYGQVQHDGRTRIIHRVAYELLVGPIPNKLTLDHLCRQRPCINPSHLEPVTIAENVRRAARARTHCKQGHALDDAYLIQRSNGPTQRACRQCQSESGKARRRREAGSRPVVRMEERAHCPAGHIYDEQNTYTDKQGHRSCRACHRRRQHDRYHAGRALASAVGEAR